MSKILSVIILLSCICAGTWGCDEIQRSDSFTIRLQATARLPAGEGEAPLAFPGLGPLLDVDLANRDEFTDRGYTAADATALRLGTVRVFAVQPPAQTLGFFGDLRVVIDTEALPAVVAAQGEGASTRTVDLRPQQTDLRDYLAGRRGIISLHAGESEFPPVETTLRVEMEFEVTIGD